MPWGPDAHGETAVQSAPGGFALTTSSGTRSSWWWPASRLSCWRPGEGDNTGSPIPCYCQLRASPTRSATVTPVDHTPPRWIGHRAAQAVWTLLIVLFAVLLVIALVDHTSILAIATPASSLVVAVNLLRFSLRARRAPGGGGTPS